MSTDGAVSLKKFKNFTEPSRNAKRYCLLDIRDEDQLWVQKREGSIFQSNSEQTVNAIRISAIFHTRHVQMVLLSGVLTVHEEGDDRNAMLKQHFCIDTSNEVKSMDGKTIKLVKSLELAQGITYVFQIDFDTSWKTRIFFRNKFDDPTQLLEFFQN